MIQTTEETRRHRRARLSSDEQGVTVQQGANVLWLYAMCTVVPLLVAVFCLTVGPDSWLVVGVIASLATVVAGAPLVAMLLMRQRDASALRRVRAAVRSDPSEVAHFVRVGSRGRSADGTSALDAAPEREGVVSVIQGSLHLRCTDGTLVQFPLVDLLGAVLSAERGKPSSADVYLRDGDAFELRMSPAQLRALGVTLTRADVRLLFDRPQQG